MQKKKIITIVAVLILVLIIVGVGFVFFSKDKTQENLVDPSAPTPTPAEVIDNGPASQNTEVPPEVQAVIDANQADIYQNENNEVAASFPAELFPMYRVNGVGSSMDITDDQNRPGWINDYGSDASKEELVAFYQSLLSSAPDFQMEESGAATVFNATLSGFNASITISPNNPAQTGLEYTNDVRMTIVKVQ